MKTVQLKAEGNWKNRTKLPDYGGIYFVYAATMDEKNQVCDKRLLYIGETDNIHERHNGTKEKPAKHEHYDDFINELGDSEVLKYVTAEVKGTEKERKEIQNALIFRNNPPVNTASTKSYGGEDISISFSTEDKITPPDDVIVKKGENRE